MKDQLMTSDEQRDDSHSHRTNGLQNEGLSEWELIQVQIVISQDFLLATHQTPYVVKEPIRKRGRGIEC